MKKTESEIWSHLLKVAESDKAGAKADFLNLGAFYLEAHSIYFLVYTSSVVLKFNLKLCDRYYYCIHF